MKRYLLAAVLSAAAAYGATSSTGLPIDDKLLTRPWSARWIVHHDGPHRDAGVFHFRKKFDLPAVPAQFIVHVSADNRYRLFVNGKSVSLGPARSDLDHWRYETVDIAPQLKPGRNVVAAVVWNFGVLSPVAQHSERTAFLLQGNTDAEAVVNTPNGWVSMRDDSYELIDLAWKYVKFYYAVGPGERVTAAKYPWGWEQADYDDSSWQKVDALGAAQAMELFTWCPTRWRLTPRPIPPMEETPQRLARVARTVGVDASPDFARGKAPVTVPANTKAEILLDLGFLTTAYPALTVSGGRGAEIKVNYAEGLRYPDLRKANRNEIEGKRMLSNNFDIFVADGGRRTYRPLWWRTYRYVQLDVQTKGQPLKVEDFLGDFTAYPVTRHATLECPNAEFTKMLEIGWRTQRVCSNEHYFDTPQYEQLAYAGDGRLEAMITFTNLWDDRLNRNHIEQMWYSAVPEGMIQDRYPSREPQYIPSYGLDWIRTLHDFYYYRDDPGFLAKFMPETRLIIDWYLRRLDENHLVRVLSWTDEKYNGPVPMRFGENEPDARNQIELILAMRDAAELEEAMGEAGRAERYRLMIPQLKKAAMDAFWLPERGLLARNRDRKDVDEHSNVLGILADVIPADKQRAALEYTLAHWDELPRVAQAKSGYFFFYFRHLAMAKVGLGDKMFDQLGYYRKEMAAGFTTWGEGIEIDTRSDSHAWSAGLNANAFNVVCGIEPAAPGFRVVKIAPHLNGMPWLNCEAPHPHGDVRLKIDQNGATVSLPPETTGWLEWKGQKIALRPGEQKLRF